MSLVTATYPVDWLDHTRDREATQLGRDARRIRALA